MHWWRRKPSFSMQTMRSSEAKTLPNALLDPEPISAIKALERDLGRDDVFAGFLRELEASLARFGAEFRDYVARGNCVAAQRAAHTLKGTCRQLGARALGELFADIERTTSAGNYAEAKRKFDAAASLVARSLEALKLAQAGPRTAMR
jgi:HPt (histidine-containing phosphotransfer) domain-containing protein